MKFTAKTEYGVRAILDIALNAQEDPTQVKEIAQRQAIPERFLEQVMTALRKGGLVESLRGAQGGYLLAKPPSEITLADIIGALEGPMILMECLSRDQNLSQRCEQIDLCVVRDVWKGVQSSIVEALDSITLEDMCKRRAEKEGLGSYMYHI